MRTPARVFELQRSSDFDKSTYYYNLNNDYFRRCGTVQPRRRLNCFLPLPTEAASYHWKTLTIILIKCDNSYKFSQVFETEQCACPNNEIFAYWIPLLLFVFTFRDEICKCTLAVLTRKKIRFRTVVESSHIHVSRPLEQDRQSNLCLKSKTENN